MWQLPTSQARDSSSWGREGPGVALPSVGCGSLPFRMFHPHHQLGFLCQGKKDADFYLFILDKPLDCFWVGRSKISEKNPYFLSNP